MIKIFAHNNHHELELLINNWIAKNQVCILDIKYTISNCEDCILYSALLLYQSYNDKPC